MLRIRLYFEPNIIKAQVRYFAVNLEQTTRKRSKYTTGVAYKVQRPLSFFPANAWTHVKRSLLKRGRMRARCLGKMRQTHYHASQSGVTLKIERTLLLITVRIPEFPYLLIHSSFVYEAIFRINPNFRSFLPDTWDFVSVSQNFHLQLPDYAYAAHRLICGAALNPDTVRHVDVHSNGSHDADRRGIPYQ